MAALGTVTYADDLVVGFENRMEAERFLEAFRERLAKFGLELHPEKTRLIEFGRFAAQDREKRGEGKPETFTFLGFTHYCGKRRSNGSFIVWRKTAKTDDREVAGHQSRTSSSECTSQLRDVSEWLRKVVTAITNTMPSRAIWIRLNVFRHRLRQLWAHVIRRRSQRSRLTWQRLNPLLDPAGLPPRGVHPLSYRSVLRPQSKVGAVCAKVRSYGSVRGALSDDRPYRVHVDYFRVCR